MLRKNKFYFIKYFTIFLIILDIQFLCSQTELILKVLKENKVGRKIEIDSTFNGEYDKLCYKYLGRMITKDKDTLKIVTLSRVWGFNYHTIGRIYFYGSNDQYLGHFYVGSNQYLPHKLKNGKLIFSNNKKKDCDKRLIDKIDLNYGIPEVIFLRCEESSGDIYRFSPD